MGNKSPTTLSAMLALKKLFSNRRKWVQHLYITTKHKNTCYCLMGGIDKVAKEKIPGLHPFSNRMLLKQNMLIAMGFNPGPFETHSQCAVQWNDAPGRKVSHVQLRIDEGIRRLRKRKKT